jgi:uncharacterized repeat protein (TIGR01451 family)
LHQICRKLDANLMKPFLELCLLAVAGLTLGQAALAQSPAVTSTLTAQRVEIVAGKPVLQPATQSKPGDTLQYTGTYRNTGGAPVSTLQATVPVPAGTTFIAGSAQPAAAQASTDGIAFAPMPLMRSAKKPDGSETREPVPLADYRALRWDVGTLAAAGSATVSLRVRIDAPPAGAAGAAGSAKP